MRITSIKGKHFNEDKLFFIETEKEEPFSLYKLLLLINQLAINEHKKYETILERGFPWFFKNAINDFIEYGAENVNFLNDNNDSILKELCDKYQLNFEKFKQTKLEEFDIYL